MVKKNKKGKIILAIAVFVIALFLFVNTSLAKIDISHYIERIKTSLNLEKSLIMGIIPDGKLKKILSSIIETTDITSDITYGLIILSALNEMELIDLVISQDYKIEARQYFNQILDERLNITDHCVNLVHDVQTILSSGKIIEPTTAMLLNTFQITDKIVNIFIAFENVKIMKIYDGLWVYFDARNGGESHFSAWEDTKMVMNWAAKKPLWAVSSKDRDNKELENQFSILFDKWGSHVSMSGVNEDYKEKIRSGLRNDLVFALNRYELIEREREISPSLMDKTKLAIGNIIEKTEKIKETVINLAKKTQEAIKSNISITQTTKKKTIDIQKDYTYSQAMSLQLEKDISEILKTIEITDQIEEIEKETEEITELIIEEIKKDSEEFNQEIEHKITLEEIQEIYDEIAEKVDIISQKVAILVEEKRQLALKTAETEIENEENEEIQELEDKEEQEEIENEEKANTETVICSIATCNSPKKEKVILNEIAWMGTEESSNNEWIELKNISHNEINLKGWQILNKEEKITIIIEQDYILKPEEFFLLERTDDDSVPEITADIIYTGAIKNSEETLYLFDNDCVLQDRVFASPDWAVGDNSSKRTMERNHDLTWHTSNNIEGTPRDNNTWGYYPRRTNSSVAQTQQDSPPVNILITEVQIASASSTNDDFIELYNPNTQEVDISQWSIQKSYSTSITIYKKNFETGNKIPAKGYFLIVYSDSINQNLLSLADMTHKTFNLAENNTVYLVTNQEKIENGSDSNIIDMIGFGIDIVEFENLPAEGTPALNPPPDRSLGRKWLTTTENYIDTDNNQEDFELQYPTPGEENISPEEEKEKNEDKLIASFTYSPQSPNIGEEVLLDASSSTSTTEIISYDWSFGDNSSTSTNQATTTHSFASLGNFIVTLTINNSEATSSATSSINIIEEATTTSVVINEIAWMGTAGSSFDEWIELYNTTDSDIDLNNWSLNWGESSINFSTSTTTNTIIPANGFYLIERTNDETTDILADWKGSFGAGLNNNGEKIILNNHNQIIDTVDCSEKWFAGENIQSYKTMERINTNMPGSDSNNWASNNLIIKNGLDVDEKRISGTPKQQNSVSITPTPVTELYFDENITEIIFSKNYHPYLIENDLLIPENKKLTIKEGVIIKLNNNRSIVVEGVIETPATSTESIVFTSWKDDSYGGDTNNDASSTTAQPGDWEQIHFNNSVNSSLNNIIVKYGGTALIITLPFEYLPSVNIEGGSIEFKNSTITNALLEGVRLDNTSSTLDNITFSDIINVPITTKQAVGLFITEGSPTIQNCIFENNSIGIKINKGSPIINNCTFDNNSTGLQVENGIPEISNNNFQNNEKPIYLNLSASPVFSSNIAQHNVLNGISLIGNQITATTTWSADLPYLIGPRNIKIQPEGSLIIQPGTIIKSESWNQIDIFGKLLAQGTPEQQITFTTLGDDGVGGDVQENGQGTLNNWKGLHFHSPGSILNNSIIKYGGTSFMDTIGAINIAENVDVLISNSIIRQNRYAFLLTPIPEENSTTTVYCNSIKIRLDQLKAENVFCSNMHDTYELCNFVTNPECSF